jgi:hypothetical protein
MTANAYFKLPKVLRRLYEGPLGDYVDLYAAQLLREDHCYPSGRAVSELWVISVSGWPASISILMTWTRVSWCTTFVTGRNINGRFAATGLHLANFSDCFDRSMLSRHKQSSRQSHLSKSNRTSSITC